MTRPADQPPADGLRWRALEVGPGGVPAEQVRPTGPDLPMLRPQLVQQPTDAWQNWMQSTEAYPPVRRGLSNATIGKIVGVLVALGLVVGLAVWANVSNPLRGSNSSNIAVADCLSSIGQRIGSVVPCDSPQADFAVVGRYAGSSDATDCSATPSDVAVVLSGPTLLCLDYVAAVGDCIFAGTAASGVGKVSCDSTLPGVYRVDEILHNSIDPDACPSGTTQTLVHLHNSEVICLGRT